MPNNNPTNPIVVGKIIFWCFLVLCVFMFIFGTFYIVGAGERAVLVTLGKAGDTSMMPGLHFKLPFVQ